MLAELAARGFRRNESDAFQYAPDDVRRHLLDRVADLYATRRVTIIGLIFAGPEAPALIDAPTPPEPAPGLRASSNAFRLRPEDIRKD